MQANICSRCGKNPAVVFITKIEGSQTKSEGLCLKCARELHIKPVEDIMNRMGISDEDLDGLTEDMMGALSGAEDLAGLSDEGSPEDEDGKTATFPPLFGKLLDSIRGSMGGPNAASNSGSVPSPSGSGAQDSSGRGPAPRPAPGKKRKFLDNYCIDLTGRAKRGELDSMIG